MLRALSIQRQQYDHHIRSWRGPSDGVEGFPFNGNGTYDDSALLCNDLFRTSPHELVDIDLFSESYNAFLPTGHDLSWALQPVGSPQLERRGVKTAFPESWETWPQTLPFSVSHVSNLSPSSTYGSDDRAKPSPQSANDNSLLANQNRGLGETVNHYLQPSLANVPLEIGAPEFLRCSTYGCLESFRSTSQLE